MRFIHTPKDRWHTPPVEDGPPVTITPRAHLLLDLGQWHATRAHWPAGLPVGLRLANDDEVEEIAGELPRFDLIALHFPKFADGRAYSQARLLRSRYRYGGEIRATGDVLVDMLPLLRRTGFDAVVLRADQSIEAAERALGFFPAHYQGDVHEQRPLFAQPPGTAERLVRSAPQQFIHQGAAI